MPRVAIPLALLALVAASCTASPTGAPEPERLQTGRGVTDDPCPEAVNPDNGCIYLGTLSDLSEGPFVALAVQVVAGQRAFWRRVNRDGGLGGYDIDVTRHTRDNKSMAAEQIDAYDEIRDSVLMLAQTLGTETTLAVTEAMIADDMVGAPASWWSGWSALANILESGDNYCIEAMNGLDWYASEHGTPAKVNVIHFDDAFGRDFAAGVALWASANQVAFDAATDDVPTLPFDPDSNQDHAVEAILDASPDVVLLGVGPNESGEIVGKLAAQGYNGQVIGAAPTWNAGLMASDAGPAIASLYVYVAPWGPYGSDTPAHNALAAEIGAELPDGFNEGLTAGWIWQYPLKALLEAAIAANDLRPASLVALAGSLEGVDYEGALALKSYAGTPAETVVRESVIVKPDAEAASGSSVVQDFTTGPTAEAFEFTGSCVER